MQTNINNNVDKNIKLHLYLKILFIITFFIFYFMVGMIFSSFLLGYYLSLIITCIPVYFYRLEERRINLINNVLYLKSYLIKNLTLIKGKIIRFSSRNSEESIFIDSSNNADVYQVNKDFQEILKLQRAKIFIPLHWFLIQFYY